MIDYAMLICLLFMVLSLLLAPTIIDNSHTHQSEFQASCNAGAKAQTLRLLRAVIDYPPSCKLRQQ